MVRPGKEPAVGDDATQLSGQEARWLNGVTRQLRPDAAAQRLAASQAAAAKRTANPADAAAQRVAASKAAAAKRTANAMPAEVRKAKRAKHMQ